MIDLEKDLHLTFQDLRDQERVRQRRQCPVSLDEYMDFLASLQALLPQLAKRRSRDPARVHPEKPFELRSS